MGVSGDASPESMGSIIFSRWWASTPWGEQKKSKECDTMF